MPQSDRRKVLVATSVLATAPHLLRAACLRQESVTPPQQRSVTEPRIRVTHLRVAGIDRPLGLQQAQPGLSWALESDHRNVRQLAYRIGAASSAKALESRDFDLWDSGRVESDRTSDNSYQGRVPRSRQRVWWCVQVWDESGHISLPSEASWFEMGLFEEDWQAKWVVVEDPDERQDRESNMQWIWSEASLGPNSRKFRATYWLSDDDLTPVDDRQGLPRSDRPSAARGAQLLVSGKDRLIGVWVNGLATPLPSAIHWGTLTPLDIRLEPGRNVICIEVAAATLGLVLPLDGGALAALVKLALPNGNLRRHGTGPHWRTSYADVPGWTDPSFDDRTWPGAVRSKANIQCDPGLPHPAMLLRREFNVRKPIARARLYATALGVYEAYLNGRRVGDARLSPEVTVASDHVLYQSYDVTELLVQGANALGALVGDGWYAGAFGWHGERYSLGDPPRRFFAQLMLDYPDGTTDVVFTDERWRICESAIRTAEIYNGENYDARAEQPRWNCAGFHDRHWSEVTVGKSPGARLVAQCGPAIRATQVLLPQRIVQTRPGVFIVDFGQNFAGWCRLIVKGARGTVVQLRHAELLKSTGDLDMSSLGRALATDTYTLRGDSEAEIYEPHFTYHGFRYVEVQGYPDLLTAQSIAGVVAHSDLPITGQFQANNRLVQQLWSNAFWSQRSNFFGVPTDCPQRDERMGWTADIQLFADAASFNMDVNAFVRRYLREIRAEQAVSGAFPIVVPEPRSFGDIVTSGWSEAGVILPWTLFQRYGDTGVVRENWAAMQAWLAYVIASNPDFIWRNRRGIDLGDWLAVDTQNFKDETTPYALIATAYWAYCASLMESMARAIEQPVLARDYANLRSNIEQAFAREFLSSDGRVGNDSQTSLILGLRFSLVPESLREAVASRLVEDIRRRGTRLSTGFLGTPYLLDVLADAGHEDVAVSLLLQTDYPSWGYMVKKGATTMWERWNADVDDGQDRSQNHYAFGAIAGFMYRRLAGISPAAPGFRQLEVAPIFDPRIGTVSASYQSCRGRISTRVSGDQHGISRLQLEIPPGASARVHLPQRPGVWRESRRKLTNRPDLQTVEARAKSFVVEVGSGCYEFGI